MRDRVEVVEVPGCPPNNPTYSQATRWGGLVFVSGQLGVDPATRELVAGGLSAETRQALENVARILAAAGSSLSRVVRVNIYLTHFDMLSVMNEVYAQYFPTHKPAKTTVEISRLDRGAMIEIEVIAAAD
jgi:2-iminobutanoate/2-iminopropanoate deaminase